jgi:hypothetical protein
MEFVPAGELIDKVSVRSVRISESPGLPAGEYTFIDAYCTDRTCDCRKVMFYVMHERTQVATIDFGWETEEYYREWMGEDSPVAMAGVTVVWSTVPRDVILSFFNHLLDGRWIAIVKDHYDRVKKATALSVSQPPELKQKKKSLRHKLARP